MEFDQTENDAGGGAGGGVGSQDGGNAIERAAAAALTANAQDGSGNTAAKPDAGTADKTNQSAAEAQHEIDWNGQKVKKTLQELKNLAQQAYNNTQNAQENAKIRKEMLARIARIDQIEAEYQEHLKKSGAAEGEGGEPPDPIKTLSDNYQRLNEKELLREWKDAYNPIAQKYPNMDEDKLSKRFLEKRKLGEVEDSAAGLMEVAAEVAQEITAENGANEDKQIEKLLANDKNPKLTAYKQKIIADFVAGKTKLAAAGGDNGKGPNADAQPKKETISEVAERLRGAA